MRPNRVTILMTSAALVLGSCSGGGGSTSAVLPTPTPSGTPTPSTFFAVPAAESLSVADVQTVIARAAAEAPKRRSADCPP